MKTYILKFNKILGDYCIVEEENDGAEKEVKNKENEKNNKKFPFFSNFFAKNDKNLQSKQQNYLKLGDRSIVQNNDGQEQKKAQSEINNFSSLQNNSNNANNSNNTNNANNTNEANRTNNSNNVLDPSANNRNNNSGNNANNNLNNNTNIPNNNSNNNTNNNLNNNTNNNSNNNANLNNNNNNTNNNTNNSHNNLNNNPSTISEGISLLIQMYQKIRILNMIYQNLRSISNESMYNQMIAENTSLIGGILNIINEISSNENNFESLPMPQLSSNGNEIISLAKRLIDEIRQINNRLLKLFNVENINRVLNLIESSLSAQNDRLTNIQIEKLSLEKLSIENFKNQ